MKTIARYPCCDCCQHDGSPDYGHTVACDTHDTDRYTLAREAVAMTCDACGSDLADDESYPCDTYGWECPDCVEARPRSCRSDCCDTALLYGGDE